MICVEIHKCWSLLFQSHLRLLSPLQVLRMAKASFPSPKTGIQRQPQPSDGANTTEDKEVMGAVSMDLQKGIHA